jgi:hypothetical protein
MHDKQPAAGESEWIEDSKSKDAWSTASGDGRETATRVSLCLPKIMGAVGLYSLTCIKNLH